MALQTHINDIMMKRYSKVCSPFCHFDEPERSTSVCLLVCIGNCWRASFLESESFRPVLSCRERGRIPGQMQKQLQAKAKCTFHR